MDATPNEQLDERIARRKWQNAARVKRFRERKARGGVAFRVDLDGDDVAKLVTIGLLTEAQRHDPAAVKVAALKLIKAQATNAAANAAQSATARPPSGPNWFVDHCNQCRRFTGRLEAFLVNGQKVLFYLECWQTRRDAHRDVVAQSAPQSDQEQTAGRNSAL